MTYYRVLLLAVLVLVLVVVVEPVGDWRTGPIRGVIYMGCYPHGLLLQYSWCWLLLVVVAGGWCCYCCCFRGWC